jgi:putative membrane protein insertion efficiency factor
MKSLLLRALRAYQYLLRPLLGANCRFYPSCSDYAYQAIDRFGAIKGSGLAAWRLCKCHPYHPGGYDPVPEQTPAGADRAASGQPARTPGAPATSPINTRHEKSPQ